MNPFGREGLLVLALMTCTAADVQAFALPPAVPATSSIYRSSKLPDVTLLRARVQQLHQLLEAGTRLATHAVLLLQR